MPRTRHQKLTPPASAEPDPPDLRARLAALNAAAAGGDPAAVTALGAFLDAYPEVWRQLGDQARFSAEMWCSLLAGGDPLGKEAARRWVAGWAADLAGPAPAPAVRAVADVAASARLALAHAEAAYAAAPSDPARGRRLDAALGRLAAVVKLLTRMRAAGARGTAPAAPPGATCPRLHGAVGRRRVG